MPDLKVDLGLLQTMATSLGQLSDEFEKAGDIVDAGKDCVGEPSLIGALGDFADNWKVHREKLVNSIKQTHDRTVDSYNAYEGTDSSLTQSLQSSEQHTTTNIVRGAE